MFELECARHFDRVLVVAFVVVALGFSSPVLAPLSSAPPAASVGGTTGPPALELPSVMPATSPVLSITPGSGPVDTSVTLTVSGFPASASTHITWNNFQPGGSGTACTGTTNASGGFRCTFVIPPPIYPGTTDVSFTASDTFGDTASADFTLVPPSFTVSPTSGPVGTLVTFHATSYAPNKSITVTWSGGTACSGTTSGTGAFSCTFTIPARPCGTFLTFTGTDAVGDYARASFQVTGCSLAVSPTSGPVDTSVTLTVTKFATLSATTITWNDFQPGGSGTACTGTTNASGGFRCTFVIPPPIHPGTTLETFTATDAFGDTASANFQILPPSLTVSPSSGAVGNNVTLQASDYAPSASISINVSGGGTACSGTTSGSGAFSCTFTIPPTPCGSSLTFNGTDAVGDDALTSFLAVGCALEVSPTSGPVDTSVELTASGFSSGALLSIAWNDFQPGGNGTACSGTTNLSGGLSCEFVIPPPILPGTGQVEFTATDALNETSSTNFTVVPPALLVSPGSGPSKTVVNFTGTSFAPASPVSVIWTGGTACAGTTNATGGFQCSFSVPYVSCGTFLYFNGTDAVGDTARTFFLVNSCSSPPSLHTSPGSEAAGLPLVLTASGFFNNSPMTITWLQGTACSGAVNSSGTFVCTFALPNVPAGPYTFTARDGAGDTASTGFTVLLSPVTFAETGLPPFTSWSVLLNGTRQSSASSTIVFDVNAASYPFFVPLVSGGAGFYYTPTPLSGNVTVTGASTQVNITFLLVPAYPLTFLEKQLPVGAIWSVDDQFQQSGANKTVPVTATTMSRGAIGLQEPNGSLNFTIHPPAGFGVARISGPGAPNQTEGTVAGPRTWVVTFGPLVPLYFNESALPQLDLYPGAAWSVLLTPRLAHGGPAPQSGETNGTSVNFTVPAGAAYTFTVTILAPGAGSYKIAPAHGGATVPLTKPNAVKTIKFKLLTQTVVFKESHLAKGNNWTVTITSGTTPVFTFPLSASKAVGTGGIGFKLPVGTYTYTVTATNSQVPTPASGTFSVTTAPSPAQVISITFA